MRSDEDDRRVTVGGLDAVPARKANLHRYLRWVLPAVLLVEVVLLATGVIGLGDGAMVAAVIEGTVLLVVVVEVLIFWKAASRARDKGATVFDVVSSLLDRMMPAPVATVVRHDLVMMRALWLVVRGRSDVSRDGSPIQYSRGIRPLFWVMLVLNPVEIAFVELVIPWAPVRIVLMVLGILGTIWFLALIATLYKYPHSIDRDVLRVRYLSFFDCRIPVDKIESVRQVSRSRSLKRSLAVVDDGVLAVEIAKMTNVSVSLREPHLVDLGRRGTAEVSQIDFWADDLRAATVAIRSRIDS